MHAHTHLVQNIKKIQYQDEFMLVASTYEINTAFSSILKVYFLKTVLPLTPSYFLHMEIKHFLYKIQG